MTIRNAFKFAVTLALVFAVVGAYGVFTAKASMESISSVRGVNHPPTVSGNKTLKKTVFASGFSGVSLPVGTFVTIDGAKFSCGAPTTCTYQAENWLQIGASATSNWALLTTLDGSFIGDGGPYLGPVGTDFTGGSWMDVSTSVGPGSHTLQTQAFMRDASATAFNYSIVYQQYKP